MVAGVQLPGASMTSH